MIDNFSINTEGKGGGEGHYGFCHRRHAVMNPFKDREILHNTRDGSEFYVPYLSLATCNFRERTWALGRVGGGREGIPGLHTCLLRSLLKNIANS